MAGRCVLGRRHRATALCGELAFGLQPADALFDPLPAPPLTGQHGLAHDHRLHLQQLLPQRRAVKSQQARARPARYRCIVFPLTQGMFAVLLTAARFYVQPVIGHARQAKPQPGGLARPVTPRPRQHHAWSCRSIIAAVIDPLYPRRHRHAPGASPPAPLTSWSCIAWALCSHAIGWLHRALFLRDLEVALDACDGDVVIRPGLRLGLDHRGLVDRLVGSGSRIRDFDIVVAGFGSSAKHLSSAACKAAEETGFCIKVSQRGASLAADGTAPASAVIIKTGNGPCVSTRCSATASPL